MKFSVIIAARMGSSRLPGKALLPLGGISMLRFLIRRIGSSALASDIVVATTELAEDDQLAAEARAEGIRVFRGAVDDVVLRFDNVSQELGAEFVVRVTGDCPFTDGETLDHCLEVCGTLETFDLASTKTLFPVGIDYEIYRAESLRRLHESGQLSPADREHVTKYFYEHPSQFCVRLIEPRPEWKEVSQSFTVDTLKDYRFARKVVDLFGSTGFSVADLILRAGDLR